MILQHGSPSNLSGRSEREIRTYEFLDSLGIQFDRTDHPDQPATSMEVCADVDEILNVHICKNLFLSSCDARGQTVQDERALQTDGDQQAVFRR